MKIPAKDLERFKDMAIQLKAAHTGVEVRAGYAMEVMLARIEELEPKEAPTAPEVLKGKAKDVQKN